MMDSQDPYIPLKLQDLRVLTFYDKIKDILRGKIPYPRTAIIYPVYGCNYNCCGCEYSTLNSKPTMLEFQRFISLIDELSDVGVEGIEFCGGGEPTLYPKLKDIISYGKTKGMSFGILTNGTMPESLAEFLAKNLSYIRITMNAGSKEVYLRFQSPKIKDAWEIVCDRIKIINSSRKMNNPRLIFGMKAVIGKNNIQDIENMVEFSMKMGFDNLQIKLLRQDKDSLNEKEEKLLEEKINEIRGKYNFKIIYNGKNLMQRVCILTPLQTTIDAKGDVFLCCYFSYRQEQHKIGNIYEKKFHQIWGTEEHIDKIKNINPELCNLFDCRFIRYHKVIENLVEKGSGQFEFI